MNELDIVLQNNARSSRRMDTLAPLLAAWFEQELAALHRTAPQNRGGLLMGVPIWGEEYMDRMVRYSLPTLGTERNLEALSGKAAMVFYGIRADRAALWKATRWMRQSGIPVLMRDIPDEIMQAVSHSEDKYALLAVVHNLIAAEAGHNGMGMHMYCADHAYSEAYFENLARLGGQHAAVIQQGMSANITAMAPDLEAYRNPETGALAIPPRELGGLALKHIHMRTAKTIANSLDFPNEFPASHQMTWIGKDAVHMAATPQNIAWLCPELCLDTPIAFTSTLDMLPPEYIPEGHWYMVQPEDEMVFCEMSPATLVPPQKAGGMQQFVMRYWQQVSFTNDYNGYFAQRCKTPIPERAEGEYMTEEQIAEQHAATINAVKANKAWAMDTYFRSAIPVRW